MKLGWIVLCVFALACGSDDDGGVDAALPDAPLDVPVDMEPMPGEYPGDVASPRSCEDVCVDEGLICDARYRWSGFLTSHPGGGRGIYRSSGGSTTTDSFGCYVLPPPSVELDPTSFELESYQCACTFDPEGILDDVEQIIATREVYRGAFSLAEPATATYTITDGYLLTANNWTVAIVPMASVDAYLAGEAPMVYGEFVGEGSTMATADLPAGDYVLVLQCQNRSDPCRFHTLVTL